MRSRMSFHLALALSLAAVAGATGAIARGADPWIRGSGEDLEIRILGEVVNPDGQPAENLTIACGMLESLGVGSRLDATVDGNRFEVWVPVNSKPWTGVWLKVASSDGSRVAYWACYHFDLRKAAIEGVTLTLEPPTRRVEVRVTHAGAPVPDATVKADLSRGVQESARTNARGVAHLDLLADQRLIQLAAWTADRRIGGISVWYGSTRNPDADQFDVELNACRDQRIRLVDPQGEPPPGVEFAVRVANPRPRLEWIPETKHGRLRTDASGEVVHRWLPDSENHHVVADVEGTEWVIDQDLRQEPRIVDGVIEIKVKRARERKRITGRVNSGATRVGGFFVQMRSFQSEREGRTDVLQTFTDTDGTFTCDVLPDVKYTACVIDTAWASRIIDLIPYESATGEVNPPKLSVSAGQEVEALVTSGPRRAPYRNLDVAFMVEHRYSWEEDGRTRSGTSRADRYVATDAYGRASVRALPGELTVAVFTPLWRAHKKVTVREGQPTRVTLHQEFDEDRAVTGSVVLPAGAEAELDDVSVLVGALDGAYQEKKSTTCADDGSFSSGIRARRVGVFGETGDGRAAGSLVTQDLSAPLQLRLRRTVDFHGRLLGEGDRPLAHHGVRALVSIEIGASCDSPTLVVKRMEARTDERGDYTLPGVPTGLQLSVYADSDDGPTLGRLVESVRLEPGESRARSVSRLTRTPPPATAAELSTRYGSTLRDARLGGFRTLLILANGAADVNGFVSDHFLDHARNQQVYALVPVVVDARPDWLSPEDAAFLRDRGFEAPGEGSVAAYAIGGDGERLGALTVDVGEAQAADTVADFIDRHAPPPVDARAKWDEAFAEARRSHRRVLVRVSQRFCPPCTQLSRWIDDHREILEKDYVMLKVDSVYDQGGASIADRVTQGRAQGVPFFAVFDAQGTLLSDSESPLGNIGFPGDDVEAQRHLREVLLATRRNLSVEEVDGLVQSTGD